VRRGSSAASAVALGVSRACSATVRALLLPGGDLLARLGRVGALLFLGFGQRQCLNLARLGGFATISTGRPRAELFLSVLQLLRYSTTTGECRSVRCGC